MSSELSEMIALGCPDLPPNNNGSSKLVEIGDGARRLSVKQMTATELAAARVIAETVKAETEATLAKAVAHVAEATTTINNSLLNTSSNSNSNSNSNTNNTLRLCDQTPASSTIALQASSPPVRLNNSLPLMPARRSRITSLPNILHMNEVLVEYESDDDEVEAEKPQLELQFGDERNSSKGQQTTVSEAESIVADAIKRSTSKSSTTKGGDDAETSERSIADSIELLRQQRCEGGRDNERTRRSQSPSVHFGGRNVAPERLHSSSQSSIGSVSASVSLSLNTSRRESNTSTLEEAISTSATVVLPSPPIFPLSKTTSAPNFERRKSSLSALFPDVSPLVAPEPVLHTNPQVKSDDDAYTLKEIHDIVEDTLKREIPTGKMVHRTKTPPPVGVKLGVNLKKVSPPKSHITVKKNDAPMLGVVLRKVEKKQIQQKSILDDDKPLYHLSIVRSDHKEYKPAPKPPAPLQKSATTAAISKPSPGGILTGPQQSKTAAQIAAQQQQALKQRQQQYAKSQRPMPGVPITIQKIEGDKIIIIKKIVVPKNSKIPEIYRQVGISCEPSCAVSTFVPVDLLNIHQHQLVVQANCLHVVNLLIDINL